ncbi:MAG: heterodisulfide reductase-related iron-sulfur binding cluster, partial [Thermodesulfobacteriota bacterium]
LRDKIGFDKVKEAVTKPLKGVKAAAYYGCMLLRPFEDMGIDNSESPTIMEDMLKALGADPVFFPDRVECCGAHLAMDKPDIVTKLSGKVIDSALSEGAEIIITSCPLCQYNLENTQAEGGGALPIVYFTQILGLALGQDEETLGFDKNKFSPLSLLRDKELL